MRAADFEARADEVDYFAGAEVEQLQLVVALLDLAVFDLGQSALGHARAHLVLVLDVALGEHESAVGGEVELEEGLAAAHFALEPVPAFGFAGHQRLLDLVLVVEEVVVLEQDVQPAVDLVDVLEFLACVGDGLPSCLISGKW